MYKLLKLPSHEFNAIILKTQAETGINAAIIEKDFWVCITLDYLFHHFKWKNQVAFKGGTCLSKVYHLIERFSEDIDLIMDWRMLGYKINEPWEERLNAKQLRFIEESKDRLFAFLANEFLPEFKIGMSKLLGFEINAYIDESDRGSILFAYPSSFNNDSILKVIKLEAGILASWIPLNESVIKPLLAEKHPDIFAYDEIKLLATTAERAFWEKITILHQEAHRPEGSIVPTRYSRHYYDVYYMCKKGIKEIAIKNPKLLEEVVLFKMKFYPRKWARYDLAKYGNIKLLPAKHNVDTLKKDYSNMKSMIYGEYPSFEEILKEIQLLENQLNNWDKD